MAFCIQHSAWFRRWPRLLCCRYAVIENVNDLPLPAIRLIKLMQLRMEVKVILLNIHAVILFRKWGVDCSSHNLASERWDIDTHFLFSCACALELHVFKDSIRSCSDVYGLLLIATCMALTTQTLSYQIHCTLKWYNRMFSNQCSHQKICKPNFINTQIRNLWNATQTCHSIRCGKISHITSWYHNITWHNIT